MNPFNERPIQVEDCIMDWPAMSPPPYDKNTVDPYTRTRVILMNGTAFENVWFLHNYTRHERDGDVRRRLSLLRRCCQQQQKCVSALKPPDETLLEHTIGYEQLAVDLTAALAQREPDAHVKKALDFALLEDFDHLYRFANLLAMDESGNAAALVGQYTEIMPGRPTISEHRHPYDAIKPYIDARTAAPQTKLCVDIITAAEQQTMNYYMNVCAAYPNERGRKLYQEIGMIEEQHVTQYGSLMDTRTTWPKRLLLHFYTTCYLYYSCAETESCGRIKQVWARLLEQSIALLHAAAALLRDIEGKEWTEALGVGDPAQGAGYANQGADNPAQYAGFTRQGAGNSGPGAGSPNHVMDDPAHYAEGSNQNAGSAGQGAGYANQGMDNPAQFADKSRQSAGRSGQGAGNKAPGAGDFPPPLTLQSNIPYIRAVLADSVYLTAVRENYGEVKELKPGVDFFRYQRRVNPAPGVVPSHVVISDAIAAFGQDVRFETAPNPVPALRDRTRDNTDVGRTPGDKERFS